MIKEATRVCGLEVSIRTIQNEDVSIVRALHARSFAELARDYHSPAQIAAHVALILDDSYSHELLSNNLLVAQSSDGRILGTAGWCEVADATDTARIRKVFVAPEMARCGLGRRLVQEVERQACEARRSRFRVRANANAAAFYECLDYKSVGHGVMRAANGVDLPVIFMEKN
jgi:GNAT superfamily N-acetyltransferase